MKIEIKKSIKPVKYDFAIKLLEERLLDINNNKKGNLIWLLEHEEIYTAGTSYKNIEILDKSIKVTATCVRVPVFVGHAESINIEFENFLAEEEAREVLRNSPGILVVDKKEEGGYISPVECVGDYATFVSRIRQDPTVENGINIWCVSDNLRKGAALNAVQIAELYSQRFETKER